MEVVVNAGPGLVLDKKALKKACLKVLKAESARKDTILSLSAVTLEEMRDLNRKYLLKDYATDVLAFPMREESRRGFDQWAEWQSPNELPGVALADLVQQSTPANLGIQRYAGGRTVPQHPARERWRNRFAAKDQRLDVSDFG